MFEVGDRVIVTSFHNPIPGVIVDWYFDEGDVWAVMLQDGRITECCNEEMSLQPKNI